MFLELIDPKTGPLHGGTAIEVLGRYRLPPSSSIARNNVLCSFGGVQVPAILKTFSSVVCISPPALKPQIVDLSISLDKGHSFSKSRAWFSYHQASEIKSISPNGGRVEGGTRIIVKGEGFF